MNLFLASVATAFIAILQVLSADTSKDIPPVVLLLIGSNMFQLVLLHKDVRKRSEEIDQKISVIRSATANIFGKTVSIRNVVANLSAESQKEYDQIISDLEKVAKKATNEMNKHMKNM